MGVTTGRSGILKVGSLTIGEVKSYQLTETANTIDTTSLSDSATTVVAGNTSFSGSCDVFWDKADSGQDAVLIGSALTLTVYPEGVATGSETWSGSIVVTGIDRSTAIDGTVDATLSFTGSGAVTIATVS